MELITNLHKIKSYSGVTEAIVVYNGQMEFETSDGIKVVGWPSFFMQTD